jgi:hypothetical protein
MIRCRMWRSAARYNSVVTMSYRNRAARPRTTMSELCAPGLKLSVQPGREAQGVVMLCNGDMLTVTPHIKRLSPHQVHHEPYSNGFGTA